MWKIAKSIKNTVTFETPLRKPDHSWARNSSEKASLFASHLENVFRPNSNTLITDNSLDIQQYINECNQMEIPIRKVKLHEILSIISNLESKKASGYDFITAKLLKELPMEAINFMMHIFNACLSKCWYPDQWKVAQIKMVLKPGKNGELVQSYRPIGLLPLLSKVLEIIFLNRLAVCCGVRGRALASHTGVRRFDSRSRDCLLLFADYNLRSIQKS